MTLRKRLGADGLLGAYVVVDDGAEHLKPAFTEHRAHLQLSSLALSPPRRPHPGTHHARVPTFVESVYGRWVQPRQGPTPLVMPTCGPCHRPGGAPYHGPAHRLPTGDGGASVTVWTYA
ncbi:hypothetical protein GCM10010245_77540 [Streptomyces spectabilis]|nr:hypothetical protein GCM10010245_77540 [Streptomyces spectabilis]